MYIQRTWAALSGERGEYESRGTMTERIVIFEDEGVTALHLRILLTSHGYSVPEVADSAEQAEELVGAAEADLVLMDIRLKGWVDGIEAAKLIRERFNIPVIIISAHNDSKTRRRIETSHAYGHVVKPFDDRDVVVAVRSALHRRRLEKALASGATSGTPELPQLGGAVVTTDATGRIMYMNRSAESLTGWKNADAFEHEATDVLRLSDAGTESLIAHPVQNVLRGVDEADRSYDSILTTPAGDRRPICYRVTPVEETDGALLGALVTIRRRREFAPEDSPASDKVRGDPFTGLLEVRLLTDFIETAIARARNRHSMVAVFHVNVGRSKSEAEEELSGAEPELLAAAAARLHESVRSSDAVAGTGNNSFVVIQADLDQAGGAVALGEKLVSVFHEPFIIEGREISVSASVGAAFFPFDGEGAVGLLTKAEQAIERETGAFARHFRFYSEDAELAVAEERNLAEDLDRAVSEDQFEILLQPMYDLSKRVVLGAVTHLQWNHPERGTTPASVFLPIAERNGMMASITGWVIREALKLSGAWQSVAPGIRIATPLTGSELRRRNLAPQVVNIIEGNGFDARHLELEFGEDVLVTQPPHATYFNIRQMRRLGVSLTLAKFGSAYASMLTLRNTPVNRIKIDESLVAAITNDREAQAIVTTTIDLARSYGLQVAADGIETEDQWRWLRYHGCELGQGGFLSGRLPAQKVFELLVEQHR